MTAGVDTVDELGRRGSGYAARIDPYDVFLGVLGAAVLGAAVLPKLTRHLPMSLPTIQVLAGAVLYLVVDGLPAPDPVAGDAVTERLSELVVIVSLTAAGLKIDRPIGWRRWSTTWRLLAITMPLTIAAVAVVGWAGLGLAPATALLLGAALAPTDPVLASEVQVGPPSAEVESEDEVRVSLTGEAGLNDALGFPFTNAAIAMVGASGAGWVGGWFLDDVLLKLVVGVGVGWLAGRAIGWLAFRSPPTTMLARTTEGIAALGTTLLVYGVAEVAHGYGFLAVFVAAVVLRGHERDHEYHQVLHEAADTVEQLGSSLLLVLVGGAVAVGGLSELRLPDVLLAVAVLAVIRPVAGLVGLAGSGLDRRRRLVIAVFGIRGMGSIYYVAHATVQEDFEAIGRVWSIVLLVVLLSVVLHGATAARAVGRAVEDEADAVPS